MSVWQQTYYALCHISSVNVQPSGQSIPTRLFNRITWLYRQFRNHAVLFYAEPSRVSVLPAIVAAQCMAHSLSARRRTLSRCGRERGVQFRCTVANCKYSLAPLVRYPIHIPAWYDKKPLSSPRPEDRPGCCLACGKAAYSSLQIQNRRIAPPWVPPPQSALVACP